MPEEFRADGNLNAEGFKGHYEKMAAEHASLRDRMGNVPEDASGYDYSLPENIDFSDMGLPEDYAYELRPDDPAFAPFYQELGSTLHKHGIPKDAAPELLGLMARYQAPAQAKQEKASLGPTADARISEVDRMLQARLPKDLADSLKGTITSANGVKAMERLLSRAGTLPQSQGGGGGLPDDASPMDRLRAANSHSQKQK